MIRDHPRVCGEKIFVGNQLPLFIGSPPRVRGKVENLSLSEELQRITPACAGKREEAERMEENAEDHPRVCGEKC